jgi:hypothetical protein
MLSACVFFADVLVRRVAFDWAWTARAAKWVAAKIARRSPDQQLDQRLERLRTSKAAVDRRIDERRAAARIEPEPVVEEGEPRPERSLEEVLDQSADASRPEPPAEVPAEPSPPAQEESSYTARLFEAKRRAWKNQSRKG